jgi:hypothetical protein
MFKDEGMGRMGSATAGSDKKPKVQSVTSYNVVLPSYKNNEIK